MRVTITYFHTIHISPDISVEKILLDKSDYKMFMVMV